MKGFSMLLILFTLFACRKLPYRGPQIIGRITNDSFFKARFEESIYGSYVKKGKYYLVRSDYGLSPDCTNMMTPDTISIFEIKVNDVFCRPEHHGGFRYTIVSFKHGKIGIKGRHRFGDRDFEGIFKLKCKREYPKAKLVNRPSLKDIK